MTKTRKIIVGTTLLLIFFPTCLSLAIVVSQNVPTQHANIAQITPSIFLWLWVFASGITGLCVLLDGITD